MYVVTIIIIIIHQSTIYDSPASALRLELSPFGCAALNLRPLPSAAASPSALGDVIASVADSEATSQTETNDPNTASYILSYSSKYTITAHRPKKKRKKKTPGSCRRF